MAMIAAIDANRIMHQVKVEVRITRMRRAKFRLIIAIMFFRLAGWISPTQVDLKID